MISMLILALDPHFVLTRDGSLLIEPTKLTVPCQAPPGNFQFFDSSSDKRLPRRKYLLDDPLIELKGKGETS